ncbi:MAG TPA: hypothetical protein VEU32_16435 [Burkholderiales bacterium]|nr:hypothetical protein [Burkholderiales bacterium]
MSSVEIHPSLARALQARARRERISVGRLVKRLIADGLQEVKKRLGLDRHRSDVYRS